MIFKIKILKSTLQEYVDFKKLNSSNINLTQSPYYGLSKAKVENRSIDFYTILIDDRKVGVFQILKKKYFNFITLLRINRGPILINEIELNERINIILKILKFAKIFKLRVLSITPDTSFFSIERQVTSFFSPIVPSSLGRNFGTRKTEIPLLPSGASGVLARTK